MNGDCWKTKDGQRGLEVRRNEKELMLSIIRDDWPWPDYPRWFKKSECTKLPSRYHGGEIVDDVEEALV